MSGIPAGMKAWNGGDSAPADWDGGPVLLRSGAIWSGPEYDWNHDQIDDSHNADTDIIAYTPLVNETQHLSAASMERAREWRCFHCDDVLTSERCARLHFGATEDSAPACQIKAGAEGSILRALRNAEAAADNAIQAVQTECTDAARAYHAQTARHSQALIAAEELGYERGLRAAREVAPPPVSDDWTGGRAWPEQLDAIAQYWAEWEEEAAGSGIYTAEELAECAGNFATGLADYLVALTPETTEPQA